MNPHALASPETIVSAELIISGDVSVEIETEDLIPEALEVHEASPEGSRPTETIQPQPESPVVNYPRLDTSPFDTSEFLDTPLVINDLHPTKPRATPAQPAATLSREVLQARNIELDLQGAHQ